MPRAKKTEEAAPEPRKQALAVLLELENVAIDARRIMYDVLSKLLKEKKMELAPVFFGRYCLDAPPARFMPALLKAADKQKISPEKMASSFNDEFKQAVATCETKASPVLKTLLQNLAERGVRLGALTQVAGANSAALLEQRGLSGMQISLLPYASDERFVPSADAWLKLAKSVSTRPASCIAITTSAASCKAAISAGMRCVAITGEFASFQDFGGADMVVEAMDDDAAKGVLELLDPLL